DSINEYFKQIYGLFLKDDSIFGSYRNYYEKTKGVLKHFISRIRGLSVDGIKIDPEERVYYYRECRNLLKILPEDFNTILFLIDEFPDAVKNISRDDPQTGIHFLQLIRDLRQDLSQVNLQFVYSGSIGLANVVNKLNRLDLINDIVRIDVPPLTRNEAKELITRLALGLQRDKKEFEISDQIQDYILDKDSWLIPYYIQIIVEELFEVFADNNQALAVESVDYVIQKIISDRYTYQDYFENWKTRLKQAFDSKEYNCALEILNYVSNNGFMDYDTMYDVSVKHKIEEIKDITRVLEYDGYLSKDSSKTYKFNSIILKEWWYLNVSS
ncbi:hypothetical protein K8T06_02430, partial [bacterium]|nr:hypothetical protein [bacterium]